MQGIIRNIVKIVARRLFLICAWLFPFQTQYFLNKELKGSHGEFFYRLLMKSMDFLDDEHCLSFGEAIRSDWSGLRFQRKEKMRFVDAEADEKTFFIDISRFYCHDDHTGIQRRIQKQLDYLLTDPDFAPSARLVYFDPQYKSFFPAWKFLQKHYPDNPYMEDKRRITFHKGDELVMMQCYVPDGMRLSRYPAHGVRITAVIDDVIPLQHPEMVVSNLQYKQHFNHIVRYVSKILTVSYSAIDDIKSYIAANCPFAHTSIAYGCTYNGCNFQKKEVSALEGEDLGKYKPLQGKTFVLAIGTIEPRKGYADALGAFEELWKRGSSACMVFVGRPGFKSGQFIKQVSENAEYGKKLFLFQGASDALLAQVYKDCSFVLNCSYAEGFGIPLMEATFYGKAVLARDLPVFEELMRDQARYFHGNDPKEMADAIQQALDDVEKGTFHVADTSKIDYYTWKQCGDFMIDALLDRPVERRSF